MRTASLILLSSLSCFGQGGAYSPYWQPPVVKGEALKRLPDGHPDITGYWAPRFNQAIFEVQNHPVARIGIAAGKGAIVDPADGMIPYKPEAKAKALDLGTNHMFEEPEAHCYQSGVPHSAYQQFAFQLTQSPGFLVIGFEYAHAFRIIPTDNRKHIASDVKLFMGDSVAHWEGDTLVVDVIGFNDNTWLAGTGTFHTDALHITERYTRVDKDQINYEVTMEDPNVLTKPWTLRSTLMLREGTRLQEYPCSENNIDPDRYEQLLKNGVNFRRQ